MTAPYPLQFEPNLQPRVWGGRRLAPGPSEASIGESWELADLADVAGGRSVVRNGPWRDQPLHALLARDAGVILGAATPAEDGGFPLLVKVLDADENLSVQVHPTAEYARTHPGARLKSEAWYVIHAEPDARIYRGIRSGCTREEFAEAIAQDRVLECLESVPAIPGDCHDLPSGTCHALGAGTLVAEVQTPSDTTFRVWDWGRRDRPLHVSEALECITVDSAPPPVVNAGADELAAGPLRTAHLVNNDRFRLDRLRAVEPCRFEIVTADLPVVLMTIEGDARISGGGITAEMPAITTTLVPARCDDAVLSMDADAIVLHATPPDPHRGALA